MKIYKKLIIITIAIIMVLGIGYFFNNKTETKKEDNATRYQAMVQSENNAQLDNPPKEGEGSNLEVNPNFELMNRSDVFDKLFPDDVDAGTSMLNAIAENFSYLPMINNELKEFTVKEYFKVNKDTIYKIFGINDLDTFSSFINKVGSVGSLQSYSVDIESFVNMENQFKVDVILKGDKAQVPLHFNIVIQRDTLTGSLMYTEKE